MKCLAVLALALITATTAGAMELEPWQEKAVELTKAEKSVEDATWSQKISFWVSMRDDGSRRDGFAEYLCMILNDAGRPAGELVIIKVWDHNAMIKDELKEIGRAECN